MALAGGEQARRRPRHNDVTMTSASAPGTSRPTCRPMPGERVAGVAGHHLAQLLRRERAAELLVVPERCHLQLAEHVLGARRPQSEPRQTRSPALRGDDVGRPAVEPDVRQGRPHDGAAHPAPVAQLGSTQCSGVDSDELRVDTPGVVQVAKLLQQLRACAFGEVVNDRLSPSFVA